MKTALRKPKTERIKYVCLEPFDELEFRPDELKDCDERTVRLINWYLRLVRYVSPNKVALEASRKITELALERLDVLFGLGLVIDGGSDEHLKLVAELCAPPAPAAPAQPRRNRGAR